MSNEHHADSIPRVREDLPPHDFYDPVIEAYKRDIDRSLLRENLKLTPAERAEKFQRFMQLCFEIVARHGGRAGRRLNHNENSFRNILTLLNESDAMASD